MFLGRSAFAVVVNSHSVQWTTCIDVSLGTEQLFWIVKTMILVPARQRPRTKPGFLVPHITDLATQTDFVFFTIQTVIHSSPTSFPLTDNAKLGVLFVRRKKTGTGIFYLAVVVIIIEGQQIPQNIPR